MEKHEVKKSIDEDVYYPPHKPRKESSLYRAVHNKLIHEDKLSCYICGTREQLETHHFHVEWAFANAINWNGRIRKDHPEFDWESFVEPKDFVDSEYNMMVLCQDHHRHRDRGIHNLTYPIWIVQKYIKDGYDMFEM